MSTEIKQLQAEGVSTCRCFRNTGEGLLTRFRDVAVVVAATCMILSGPSFAGSEAAVDFGTNQGERAFDGFCNDPRFIAPDGSHEPNRWHMFQDAADCHSAYREGHVRMRTSLEATSEPAVIDDPGADRGVWAFDGVCNDPRFAPDPRYLAAVEPKVEAEGQDGTDCLRGFLVRHTWPTWKDTGIAFGDDSSDWVFDGECDDPRFVGWAMANSPGAADLLRDATDCRRAHEAKSIELFSAALLETLDLPSEFNLGDDTSEWAFDGQCDDRRFAGDAMATDLHEDDIQHDATDCGKAVLADTAWLRTLPEGFDAGTNGGAWVFDDVCNDPRFAPDPRYPWAVADRDQGEGRDATDCLRGFLARHAWPTWQDTGIAFGDDSSEWAFDGECDDPRFTGTAMASSIEAKNILRDATDCREVLEAGSVEFLAFTLLATSPKAMGLPPGFELGDDSSEWAFDGECDDPRFTGETVAVERFERNIRRDATDCGKALLGGTASLLRLP